MKPKKKKTRVRLGWWAVSTGHGLLCDLQKAPILFRTRQQALDAIYESDKERQRPVRVHLLRVK